LSAWLPRRLDKIIDFVVKIGPFGRDLPPKTLTLGRLRLGCRQLRAGLAGAYPILVRFKNMAKAVTIKVKLVSSADTGFYYVAKKNSRTMTDKLVKKKYDPVARKHVEFREAKIK
jgi:large subunit ribosomal protein L33